MRIALVGTGSWGKNHARILSKLGVLCAVCDSDDTRCAEFAKKYSVNQYHTINELIESEEFDGVVIATPTISHYSIASDMIKAKKHVFVEKPITTESNKGQILADMAAKNNTILMCGYVERFNPAVTLVKSLLDEKKYGDLLMLEFHRENRRPAGTKNVGIIHDTSVHDIDTANWLFGQMPLLVFARAGILDDIHEEYASIMLGYEGNKTAIISSNWITPKKLRTFSAVCTDAIISSDFITQEVKIKSNDTTETLKNHIQEPLFLEMRYFMECISMRNHSSTLSQQAVNVTKIAEAALLSSQKGVPIYLELK